jgi:hypothetical protein
MGDLGMYNLTAGSTTQEFKLRTQVNVGGNFYMYSQASAAIAAFALAALTNAGLAAEGDTTISGAKPTDYVIPQFAVASGEYFWGLCGPFGEYAPDGVTKNRVKAAASCADSVPLYTTATAGVVDDSATDLLAGLMLTETITGAEAADCIAVAKITSNAVGS